MTDATFKLFPNPTSEILQLDLQEQKADVYITNMNGQIVYQSAAQDQLNIDVSTFANALYAVNVNGKVQSFVKK